MDTSQFGGDLDNPERLVDTSTLAFAQSATAAAGGGRGQRGGPRRRLRPVAAVRHAVAAARASATPSFPEGIPPSYAAARAVLPATVAQELCLTGSVVDAKEAHRLGIVARGRRRPGDLLRRAVEVAE